MPPRGARIQLSRSDEPFISDVSVVEGEVAERLIAPVLKTGKPARVSGVRISPSPPIKENPVAISNYAFEAGSLFFWQGVPDQARTFFKVSAGLDTGSDAGM